MKVLSLLSPSAIGPVWPAMLLYFIYMTSTTVFLVLAYLRSYFQSFTIRELRFLQRMYDATEMVSTLAILTGMIGTCAGLLEVLPALSQGLAASSHQNVLPNVLSSLRNVWVSTVIGLVLGGLWGEILMFILKPYTRPALLPVTHETPPGEPLELEEADTSLEDLEEKKDKELDDDWRQYDKTGMY
jgi:hypothetical protein